MISDWSKNIERILTGPFRVLYLLLFMLSCQTVHLLLCPFPKRDTLVYLHLIQYWNASGSYTLVLEKFPKFGLLVFSFIPLKWADKLGVPLYPASIVWMMAMSAVTVWAFYRIVLELTGDVRRALWCGALLTVSPMVLLHAGYLLRDTPYLMFALLHVLCGIYSVRSRGWKPMVLGGVTLAMCALSRFEAWELLVLSPILSLYYAVRSHFSWWQMLRWGLLGSAGFAVTVAVMLSAIDDLPLLFAKGKFMILYLIPTWLGGIDG